MKNIIIAILIFYSITATLAVYEVYKKFQNSIRYIDDLVIVKVNTCPGHDEPCLSEYYYTPQSAWDDRERIWEELEAQHNRIFELEHR